MKRHSGIVKVMMIAVAIMIATACQRTNEDPLVAAAMDMYNRYAGHSSTLTVAYIGDFKANNNTFNALVFETDDDEEWAWLESEFGVSGISEALPHDAPIGSIFVTTNRSGLAGELMDDDIEIVQQFIDSIMTAEGEPQSAVRVISDEEFFDSMGLSIEDLMAQQLTKPFEDQPDDVGYLAQADFENHVIYLFFYHTAAEMMQLILYLNQ